MSGVLYYYYVNTVSVAGELSTSNTASAQVGSSTLTAPFGIRAVPNGPGSNYVYWNPVLGATSYNLYRSTTAGGEGTTPYATGITSANSAGAYTYDSGITAGTTYFYKVAAVNSAGAGAQSAEAEVKTASARAAGPITTAASGAAQVTLTWTPVSGATSYDVYRSTDNVNFLSVKTGLAGTTYSDTGLTAGVTYYYQVDSLEATGEGNVGNTVSAVPGAPALAAPTGVRAYNYGGSYVGIAWNPVPGATSYNVYRGTTRGRRGHERLPPSGITSGESERHITSMIRKRCTNGVRYFYTVVAVDAYYAERTLRRKTLSHGLGRAQLPAPSGDRSAAGNAQVVLTWSAVTGAATGYDVARSTDGTNYTYLRIATRHLRHDLHRHGPSPTALPTTTRSWMPSPPAARAGTNGTTVTATPLATALAPPAPTRL